MPIMAPRKPARGVCEEENRPNSVFLPLPPGFLPLPAVDGSSSVLLREAPPINRDGVTPKHTLHRHSKLWAGRNILRHYLIHFHSSYSEAGLTPWKRWGNETKRIKKGKVPSPALISNFKAESDLKPSTC